MKIINALQAKAGAKTEYSKIHNLNQPTQFLPQKKKDDEWFAWNMDWMEHQGIKQIRRNSKRFLRNLRLAYGVIDRSDYIPEENPELSDVLSAVGEAPAAMDLQFFPIIPSVIMQLTGEFSKRVSKLSFRAVDDMSYNEMLEQKRQMLEDTLVRHAENKLIMAMIEQGLDPESPEAQQALSAENIRSLPEIEDFFKKNYRSVIEEWATHQKQVDEERFRMAEMEERQFKRMLIFNREFWHFKMNEDDYEIEDWDPLFVAYHKGPGVKYVSQGNWVMKIDLVTVADAIDRYGYIMNEQQLRSLEELHPVKAIGYNISGTPNDGSMYDGSKSYKWNTSGPSLGYRQMATFQDEWNYSGDIVSWLMSDNEDVIDFGGQNLIRVSTFYWKSQRKVGHLTKITEEGELIEDIVDENYVITEKPLYDTTYHTSRTKENLVYGEHIDWIWINEVMGGVKIGPNRPAAWTDDPNEVQPIYLGINRPKPGRLPFQFKGDLTLYGSKLPVEGCDFTDPNVRSVSLVDLMMPSQIGYNLVNNQISDILIDELGTVILLDHNTIPKNSMGEDWGRHNLSKAYLAMKNFQILPLDTTMANSESALQFNQYTQLNLEQTQRLLSRIELARYFRETAFEVVGITPQRMGSTTPSESATGVQQAVNNSFARTEGYFTQHCDYLMPRVHQMRTDLAQYYHSTKPSVRLQYITSMDERVNFEINGVDLLSRELNVFATTRINVREILNQMKHLAIQNNTMGGSIYDLGSILKSESIAELDRVTKAAEEKILLQRQQEMEHQEKLEQQRLEAEERHRKEMLSFEYEQREKDRQKDIMVAEIRAAGFPDTSDNGEDEYLSRLEYIHGKEQHLDQMNLKRQQENNKMQLARETLNVRRQEINAQNYRTNQTLQVARMKKAEKPKKPPKKE